MKSVNGLAIKTEDIKARYLELVERESKKGRVTQKGAEYTEYITMLMDANETDELMFLAAVDFIAENKDINLDDKKEVRALRSSVSVYLNGNASPFKSYLAEGKTKMIMRK